MEMTAVDERRMTELFENLEVPEGVTIELLRGEIVMMAGPDLVHNRIVRSVALQLPSDRWEWLMTQDIDILSEQSEPVPDLVVLGSDAGPESGRLLPSEVVTMLVEVVSKNSVDRDYGIKRSIYAAGKVPAYLIIDPIVAHCVLLTEPVGGGDEADYTVQRITKFGDPVPLDLLGFELDTSEFKTLPGVRPHRRP
ncbi:Uma2 family endonuclease [Streptomyces sioyaensis]|uniref:Uma2 family endonuclease n=2 Tax=Streptomyces sioyaensis TaxID=67364 RepID=A0A4Q1QQN0_9ACTN|nr:Uma2 family endonuclease [Streptomyces sioyaensis]MBM4791174.1 Uma2 family endonuclease [Streptomyces sioyaensis]RXS63347.1 Uma2 family endonuclease [Streptomyces sioyaensis]